jgi:hypothetical protein
VLGFASARPQCWEEVDAVNSTLPALRNHLSSGCHGAAAASAPSLLPFLSLLPAEVLTAGLHKLNAVGP